MLIQEGVNKPEFCAFEEPMEAARDEGGGEKNRPETETSNEREPAREPPRQHRAIGALPPLPKGR